MLSNNSEKKSLISHLRSLVDYLPNVQGISIPFVKKFLIPTHVYHGEIVLCPEEISRKLNVSASSIYRHVKLLCAEGYITKVSDRAKFSLIKYTLNLDNWHKKRLAYKPVRRMTRKKCLDTRTIKVNV